MNSRIKINLSLPSILCLILNACSSPPAERATEEIVFEVIGADSTKVSLSWSELTALPAFEGYGGIVNTAGTITEPALFKGISIEDLPGLEGNLSADNGIRLVASDDYSLTIASAQVREGAYLAFDPTTGQAIEYAPILRTVLAYEREGQGLDNEVGPLRLAILSDDDRQVSEGHLWVKQVVLIELVPFDLEWRLLLEGAITEEISRSFFEAGAAPGCHEAKWTDEDGKVWTGIPLWLLVGWVDDENAHRDVAFDRRLAALGYDIEIRAGDNESISLNSQRVAGNDEMILAHLVDGEALEAEVSPLRLVGAGLAPEERLGGVTALIVHAP